MPFINISTNLDLFLFLFRFFFLAVFVILFGFPSQRSLWHLDIGVAPDLRDDIVSSGFIRPLSALI